MQKEQVTEAIASKEYEQKLDIFNNFKKESIFREQAKKMDKYVNEQHAKPGEMRFNMLDRAIRNIDVLGSRKMMALIYNQKTKLIAD